MTQTSDEIEFQAVVEADDSGQRLDQFLAVPLGSRSRAARLIGAGLVTVDGRPAQKRHAMAAGQLVAVVRESVAELPARRPADTETVGGFTVVYEDAHLLVVDKDSGVVVHPAKGHQTGTLVQAVADRAAGGGDPERPGIVHRLDRDTSGVLVVAKSEAVHRELKDLLQARALHREYLALVDGRPEARTGTIDAPIGRDRCDRVLHSVDTDSPRDARTHFEVIESLRQVTLLRVVLETGRTHQIRVHMKAIGHPVTGDHSYGGSARYGLTRQFLHAARLSFPHPVTGVEVDVTAPLPADLESALQLARSESEL